MASVVWWSRAYGITGNGSGMETGNGNAPIACMCKVGIAQDTTYRVEMVLCAAMEEGTESNPINLEDWRATPLVWLRAVHLTQLCWMMKIV